MGQWLIAGLLTETQACEKLREFNELLEEAGDRSEQKSLQPLYRPQVMDRGCSHCIFVGYQFKGHFARDDSITGH